MFMCFVFNDTATNEIYTYGHTLSLHDALPILEDARGDQDDQIEKAEGGGGDSAGDQRAAHRSEDLAHGIRGGCGTPGECVRRSEEHTSELQSLMRISYAGFCLKKKINQHSRLTLLPTNVKK